MQNPGLKPLLTGFRVQGLTFRVCGFRVEGSLQHSPCSLHILIQFARVLRFAEASMGVSCQLGPLTTAGIQRDYKAGLEVHTKNYVGLGFRVCDSYLGWLP